MANFDPAIKVVLEHEGGLSDDPVDPGGVTNWGITLGWLHDFEPGATADTIRRMTRESAVQRYRDYVWDRQGYGEIYDQDVATKWFDAAVNFGERQANMLGQAALNAIGFNLDHDGVLGARTLAAINRTDSDRLVMAMSSVYSAKYHSIVEKRPASVKFLVGWLRRARWPRE